MYSKIKSKSRKKKKSRNIEHNHLPNAAIIESKKAVSSMLTLAGEVEASTQAVIASTLQELSQAAVGQIPCTPALKGTKQRLRKTENLFRRFLKI